MDRIDIELLFSLFDSSIVIAKTHTELADSSSCVISFAIAFGWLSPWALLQASAVARRLLRGWIVNNIQRQIHGWLAISCRSAAQRTFSLPNRVTKIKQSFSSLCGVCDYQIHYSDLWMNYTRNSSWKGKKKKKKGGIDFHWIFTLARCSCVIFTAGI